MVIAQRRRHKCFIGDGGQQLLMLAIRAHVNAVEVMPIALIGLLALVTTGTSAMVIYISGAALPTGRTLHAYRLSYSQGTSFKRMAGMILSLTALIGTASLCLLAIL